MGHKHQATREEDVDGSGGGRGGEVDGNDVDLSEVGESEGEVAVEEGPVEEGEGVMKMIEKMEMAGKGPGI